MKVGSTGQKILLLLLAGAALGLTRSPAGHKKILRQLSREWKEVNRQKLYRAIQQLYKSKLISYAENVDGSVSVVLNRDGRKSALHYKLDEMSIAHPEKWDMKWRLILFDIPEKKKQLRDSLRMRLQQLGLAELQKSVFVHPFECQDEIDFIIELYNARRFVRFAIATHIDNELHLKKKFRL